MSYDGAVLLVRVVRASARSTRSWPLGGLCVAAIVAAQLHAGAARACAPCSCGDPTIAMAGAEQPYRNRLRVGLEGRYGSHRMGDHHRGTSSEQMRMALLASFSPHARVTLGALLPWVTSWTRDLPRERTANSGLGDLDLSARVLVLRDRGFAPRHLLWLLVGLKFPTGPQISDSAGYPLSEDAQPGSGSWDPFAGLTYAWYSGGLLSGYVSAVYRQTTPGWSGYRRGEQAGALATLQAQPWQRFALQAIVEGLWLGADRLRNGAAMPNTGGALLRVGPALIASLRGDLFLRVAAAVPVVGRLEGLQQEGFQAMLSLTWDAI